MFYDLRLSFFRVIAVSYRLRAMIFWFYDDTGGRTKTVLPSKKAKISFLREKREFRPKMTRSAGICLAGAQILGGLESVLIALGVRASPAPSLRVVKEDETGQTGSQGRLSEF